MSEDGAHFLCCPHPHRRQSWNDFRTSLSPLLDQYNFDPTLRRVLVTLIEHIIEPNAPNIMTLDLPTEYAMLITTQHSLGEDSIFFGFFVPEWTALQSRHLKQQKLPHDTNQAQFAMKAVATAILLQVHNMWLIRNTHLHRTDPLQTHSYIHLHLLAQIKELYDCIPLMLSADRDILSYPYAARSEQTTSALQAFYKWAKPLVDKSVRDAVEMGQSFRRIDSYFRPRIPQELFDVILMPT